MLVSCFTQPKVKKKHSSSNYNGIQPTEEVNPHITVEKQEPEYLGIFFYDKWFNPSDFQSIK